MTGFREYANVVNKETELLPIIDEYENKMLDDCKQNLQESQTNQKFIAKFYDEENSDDYRIVTIFAYDLLDAWDKAEEHELAEKYKHIQVYSAE